MYTPDEGMFTHTINDHPAPCIVKFAKEDRGNVTKEDMQNLLDNGFVPVFVVNTPEIVK